MSKALTTFYQSELLSLILADIYVCVRMSQALAVRRLCWAAFYAQVFWSMMIGILHQLITHNLNKHI